MHCDGEMGLNKKSSGAVERAGFTSAEGGLSASTVALGLTRLAKLWLKRQKLYDFATRSFPFFVFVATAHHNITNISIAAQDVCFRRAKIHS